MRSDGTVSEEKGQLAIDNSTEEAQPNSSEHVSMHVEALEGSDESNGRAHEQTQRETQDHQCSGGKKLEAWRYAKRKSAPLGGRHNFDVGPGAISERRRATARVVTRHRGKKPMGIRRDMGVPPSGHHHCGKHRDTRAVLGRQWTLQDLGVESEDDSRSHPHDPGGGHNAAPSGVTRTPRNHRSSLLEQVSVKAPQKPRKSLLEQ